MWDLGCTIIFGCGRKIRAAHHDVRLKMRLQGLWGNKEGPHRHGEHGGGTVLVAHADTSPFHNDLGLSTRHFCQSQMCRRSTFTGAVKCRAKAQGMSKNHLDLAVSPV